MNNGGSSLKNVYGWGGRGALKYEFDMTKWFH